MTVTVFTLKNCPQCDATKRRLNKNGIPHKAVDLVDFPETAESFREMGYQQAPIVVTPRGTWSGYRPDKLDGLIAERRAA